MAITLNCVNAALLIAASYLKRLHIHLLSNKIGNNVKLLSNEVHSNYCERVSFFMQNFLFTILTFRVNFTPLTFYISRDLKFSLNHNFKQLNSFGGNLILKVN